MERKKFRDYLLLGAAVLGVWFILDHVQGVLDFFQMLWVILAPFLLGAAFAFVLNVPMRFLEKRVLCVMDRSAVMKKFKRPLALLLTLALTVLVIYLVMSLVIPEVITTIETVLRAIPSFIQKADEWLTPYEIQIGEFLDKQFQLPTGAELEKQIGNMLDIALKGVAFSGSVIGSVYQNILSTFFVLMFVIYFLLGKERLASQFKRLLKAYLKPVHYERFISVAALTQKTFASFITGQCLEAVILGCMFFIVLSLFKMPYVLLISVFIAVTALIPVVGAWMGCAVGAFLILVSDPMQALVFLAIFLIVQQLEGNIVYPRVMGNAIGLPSIWVLFAVVLGEGLMGILGMLIFIPLTSVCYKLLAEAVDKRLKTRQRDPLYENEN